VTESTSERGKVRRVLAGTITGTGLFLAIQFGRALWRLAQSTGGMDTKFSQVARDEYQSFLIGQNLLVLSAYALLWVVAVLLVLPAVSLWKSRFPRERRGSVALPAFLLTLAIHGYFMFRLIHSRPYFLKNADFGQWYYRILDAPPLAWQPWIHGALFLVLPWSVLAAAGVWWLRLMRPRWRAGLVAGAVVATAAGSFLQSEAPAVGKQAAAGKAPPNIIIIASDSLRSDRLGYSGYRPARGGEVSPRIDAWARDAVRFERCYTPIASTLESACTVMSSSFPHTHGIRQMYPRREEVEAAEAKMRPVAQVLAEKGYDTAAIGDWCAGYYEMMPMGFRDVSVSTFENFRTYMSQAVIMAHFVVPLYFDNPVGYQLFPQITSFASFVTPEVVTRRVEEKLGAQAASGRPFFWHVFYSCNHLPYASADPYCRMFTDPDYRGKNPTQVKFDINEFISGTGLEDKLSALPESEIEQIRALYDGCTRQFDDCFGRIVEALKKNGLAENTIIVVTSDHGDDLYEPGVTLTHGLGFNGADHCSHMPLAISGPGIAPMTLPEQVRSIDIAPTLLELAGVERPAVWEGKSLAGWMRGVETPGDLTFYGETSLPFILFRVPGVERPFLPPMDELTTVDRTYNHQFVLKPEWDEPVIAAKQRCLRTRHWKVVATPRKEGGRHYGLFHLGTDPDCRRDLAGERPEVLAPMKAALERWIDGREETPVRGIFPGGEP
jgi:arylsulfatase A-like enzyme